MVRLTTHGLMRGPSVGSFLTSIPPVYGHVVLASEIVGTLEDSSPLWLIDACKSYYFLYEGSNAVLVEQLLCAEVGPASIMTKLGAPASSVLARQGVQNSQDWWWEYVGLPLMSGVPVGRVYVSTLPGLDLASGPSLWGDPTVVAFDPGGHDWVAQRR